MLLTSGMVKTVFKIKILFMKRNVFIFLMLCLGLFNMNAAEQRRPIDSRHPLWMIHIDVWNAADPQKIIDLIPDDIRPYVCMNLSMSCQYDMDRAVYMMPQDAVQTYKSWASVCQHNGLWFTCQPASGGKTHILDTDMDTFEYFFKTYPNFLGWNYCEQFWGFDEAGNRCSSTQQSRIDLFGRLAEMSYKYGGFLTISFCGNIWSHPLTPNAMLKRSTKLLSECMKHPECVLWLYKYTQPWCFYNSESVCLSPFISGLATNYGVRYDNCGWDGAKASVAGENNKEPYPIAAGIGTVMEQTCVNGGAVWDGPELITYACFESTPDTKVDGYTRRNWASKPELRVAWFDMFRKILDGTMYIPTRQEVVGNTKIAVIADQNTGSDEDKYCSWGSLYDNIYKQNDPFNAKGNGQWMDNNCYFKSTGRYAAIPVCIGMFDDLAKAIPLQVKKSKRNNVWPTEDAKVKDFNKQYQEKYTGDLYLSRYKNQMIAYTPYSIYNSKKTAKARMTLDYNTCSQLQLEFGKLSSGAIREYSDHIDFYLNNYRIDTVANVTDIIVVTGAKSEPTYTFTKRTEATTGSVTSEWDAARSLFTLSVSHNGPVDIKINCSGSATGRKTDYLPSSQLTADLPVQPKPYSGAVTIEAEDMDYRNITANITNPYYTRANVFGHSGNGFIETGTNTSGSLRHQIKMNETGEYKIVVKYNSTKKAGKIEIDANGTKQQADIQKTGVNQWLKTSVVATLKSGENTVYVNNTSGINMMIDYIQYVPKNTPAEKYKVTIIPGSHGTAKADVTEAAEGETVTFDIKADEGYKFVGWEFHPRQHPYFKSNTMTMPNDNVILQPLFAEGSADEPDTPDEPNEDEGVPEGMHQMWALDFSDVAGGAFPEGWRCVHIGGEVQEYPNTYGLGPRTFEGFTGFQGKGLYWRSQYAEYGSQNNYSLTLSPGNYYLQCNMAAWKGEPEYVMEIIDLATGKSIAKSDKYVAEPNANGVFNADLSSTEAHGIKFKIDNEANYIIRFSNPNGGDYIEYILLECKLYTDVDTGIDGIFTDKDNRPVAIYGSDGRRRPSLQKGFNIVRMKKGEIRKIFINN